MEGIQVDFINPKDAVATTIGKVNLVDDVHITGNVTSSGSSTHTGTEVFQNVQVSGTATIQDAHLLGNTTMAGSATIDDVFITDNLVFGGYLSQPEVFHAVGDGTTDDSTAIQALVTKAGIDKIYGRRAQHGMYYAPSVNTTLGPVFDKKCVLLYLSAVAPALC